MKKALMSHNQIIHADNLKMIATLVDTSIDLIYIDPPFGSNKIRKLTSIKTTQNKDGDRTGFQEKRYKTEKLDTMEYSDKFDNYIKFIKPSLKEAYRLLRPTGSFFIHLDYRNVHYVKVMLDKIFGRECFMNEIIWAYDFGGRSKSRWSAKHDNILWYVKDPKNYTFNYDAMDRIPYMAPGLVGKKKAARGKTPTSCWWSTIVPTNSKERTGYPTQKPLKILERIVAVHSNPGDLVLDFFAGAGTTGEAAGKLGRQFIMIDNKLEAVYIMNKRLKQYIDKESVNVIDSFSDKYKFFSNFYASEVILDGELYRTVEHAYQAAKTLDPHLREVIRNAERPGLSKKLGRNVELREDWEDVKIAVMARLLRQKFSQDIFKKKLLETGDAILIEGNNWGDTFWGKVGGEGSNHLGRLLMKIREELREGD